MSLALSDVLPRCSGCNKLLGEKLTRPWTIRCPRCKTVNEVPGPGEARTLVVETRDTL